MTNSPIPKIKSEQSTTAQTANPRLIAADETLLQNLLNGSLILGTILFFINTYSSIQAKNYFSLSISVITYTVVFLITFARMIPYHFRVGLLSFSFYLIGLITLVQSGFTANGLIYLMISVLIITFLEKESYWLIPLAVISLTASLIGYFYYSGMMAVGSSLFDSSSPLFWISTLVNFLFLVFLAAGPLSQSLNSIHGTMKDLDDKNSSLVSENQQLIDTRQVFENALDRRRSRLVTTRQISREISQQSDLEKLLHDSVELIRSQLGYYHAAIYLNDDRDENAVLKAATGEAGKILLDRKFRVRIHDQNMISAVMTHGEPRIASDVSDELMQNKSSTLANTQSELTVPLKIGQHVFGVLDIQTDHKNAFGDEDVEVIQSIADQLSTVIDKATQVQNLSQQVAALEENYRSYTRGAWRSHLQGTKENIRVAYIQNNFETEFEQPEIAENALNSGEVVIAPAESKYNPEKDESLLAVPVVLRDQVLGVLNLKYKGRGIPDDLTQLVSNASDRLALALENARLLEQIQQRAEREHLVGDISTKVRASTDIDSILRTAAEELGKSLGIDEVRIQLKTAEPREREEK